MDAAAAAAARTTQAANVLSASAAGRRIMNHPAAIAPPSTWPPARPNMLVLYARSNRNSALSLARCSLKPNADTDEVTEKISTFDPHSSSKSHEQPKPTSVEPYSSSSSTDSSSFSAGLVFDLGPADCWDGAEVGSPVVKRFIGDEEERWYMWYHGRSGENPGLDSIGLAVSSNGIHWERGGGHARSSVHVGSVMNCSKDWWAFDTHSIRPSEVVVMSSTKVRATSAIYWLYYTGYSSEEVTFLKKSDSDFPLGNPVRICHGNFKSLPGLAIGQDGRNWARIDGLHYSGALLELGAEGKWDSTFIASPNVVVHGDGDLRMYYHSFDLQNGQFAIGVARSRDGIRWVKLGKIMGGGQSGDFDELGVMNARVVRSRKDGNYVMAYEGVATGGKRSIGLAESSDGLKDWRRVEDGGEVLKAVGEDGWDGGGVGSPCLVQIEGEWRLYYRGVGINGGRTGIGMAVSEGSNLRRFRRWTGFRL
ncbi:uncharacterized protein LOC131144081 [Malania oleifera]|uniref:uncharacterized protein LOC131144081 n=1 Tax=Malania oleifera TaxID=397392 RepID=UPI0025AE228B|nr:uncharacterized protein LOC131144081 [Malania oleifera]